MIQRSLILSCLAPAVALAGCAGTRNRGVESVHQPQVSRTDHALDLQAPAGQFATGEQQRLADWLGGLKLGYGDRVALDDPEGGAGPAREAVARVVGGFGLLLSDETAPVAAMPAPAAGSVRVVVTRMHAAVPGCNDWSRDSSVDYEQHTSSFYGCAVNGNLAAMVANPRDLVHGTGNTRGSDPMVVYKTIDLYRKAAPSGSGGTTVKAESVGGR